MREKKRIDCCASRLTAARRPSYFLEQLSDRLGPEVLIVACLDDVYILLTKRAGVLDETLLKKHELRIVRSQMSVRENGMHRDGGWKQACT